MNKPPSDPPEFATTCKVSDKDHKSLTYSMSSIKRVLEERKCMPIGKHTINWIAGVGDICTHPSPGTGHSASWRCDQKAIAILTLDRPDLPPKRPQNQRTALQRHCDFWDVDHDGLIYPWDIYNGFHKLGFNTVLCIWAALTMALCSSYCTQPGWLPHPLFAINIDNIHRCRHGSTTTTYDQDAEIDIHRFDAMFRKYANGKDYFDWKTLYKLWAGQCCANDWFGWFAGGLEWIALYILLWPADGKVRKDDILGVFDGTIFGKLAYERANMSTRN